MNLASAFWLAVNRFPEITAIVTQESQFSYKAWGERVRSVALWLRNCGVRPGDRVAICLGQGEMPATAFFAVHSLGAVAVMINVRWKHGDIAYAFHDSQVKVVFYDAAARPEMTLCRDHLEQKVLFVYCGQVSELAEGEVSYTQLAEGTLGSLPENRYQQDGGTILYTSGTTGRPKGVCRSPESDYLAALAIMLEHGWQRFERILSIMPLYHTMGLHTLICQVLLSGTAVMPKHSKPEEYASYLERGLVTALYLVPTMYHDLVEYAAGHRFERVKKLAFAGAPMRPELQEKCRDLFSPDVFVNQYGCTEMIAITVNSRLEHKPLSAGRPTLQTRIRVVPVDDRQSGYAVEEVRPQEVGEILVDATLPQAFLRYLNNPAATERVLRDGWYYTGDLGYLDEDGDLFLAGRVDDMIISGGENVYPHEVEEVLLKYPGVKEAVVTGVPDIRWGQRIVAYIVTTGVSCSEEELTDYCVKHPDLARFKRPREFIFVREIPKSPTGKTLRKLLKLQ